MGAANMDISGEPYLAHLTLNPDAKETILLIHGAFSSRRDWNLVAPLLADYHLLIPDLPGHGQSRHITPFSIAYAAQLLSQLIKKEAHNHIAHIVGVSLGAHVAIHLVDKYPEVASRVLVSGFEVFPATKMSPYIPYGAWAVKRIENCVPRPLVRWLMDGTDIPHSDTSLCTLDLCQQICSPKEDVDKWPSPWPHPTLIIAAGKSGFLPTADHPHDAKKLAAIGRTINSETRAVVHPLMRHPWNLQAPSVFSDTVRAWMRDGSVPDGFVDL